MTQLAPPLEAIGADLQRVEQALRTVSPPDFPQLSQLITGLIRAGGKRIRPALVLLAARFNTYDLDTLVDGAVAAELLHTATLVHDDTIDQAATRRGRATVNSVLPERATILVGDYIFAQSALYAARPGRPEVVSVFARTLREICDGEIRQMLGNHGLVYSKDEYFRRIYSKTAALFACSTEIGALLSDAPTPHQHALRLYGEKLGQAYQIIDDVLDFTGSEQETGKPVGSDLRHGTATLPVILFLENGADRNGCLQVVLDTLSGADNADIEAAIETIRESPFLDEATDVARQFADEAAATLLELPSGDARSALLDMTSYVLDRDK